MTNIFHARYVFPVSGPPLRDGFVTVEHGRVLRVEATPPAAASQVIDLDELAEGSGGVALTPGLVNAHTHLEFSDLRAPLGTRGMKFPDWIRAVLAHRRERASASSDRPEPAFKAGLRESLQSGVTTLGDINSTGDASPYAGATPRCTMFREFLGLADERCAQAIDRCQQEVSTWQQASEPTRFALSPHAPYSTHINLVQHLCESAAKFDLPLAMHLAESREELELLQAHGGPFRDLLEQFGVWNPHGIRLGSRPLDYLKLLSHAPRALVIHGNYLSDEEIEYVAARGECMSVVFCPRTHAYFAHEKYPLAKLLAAGVRMAIGTDSRASNPDLNLLAELQHIAGTHDDVSPATILNLGTQGGAKSLGQDNELGTLEPGKVADFALFSLPTHEADDVHELLLDSSTRAVATFVGGTQVA